MAAPHGAGFANVQVAYQNQPMLVGMIQQQQQHQIWSNSPGNAVYYNQVPQQMSQQQQQQSSQPSSNSWDPVMSTNMSSSNSSAFSTNVTNKQKPN
jgi:3'-phosphoadenosine 5'-phosphosulfate (PAPS) 3'-phosphatase